jgi:hypothetical protein
MGDQERRQAEAGRIPDPEHALGFGRERHRRGRRLHAGEMGDQVEGELPDQVDREHLRLEGAREDAAAEGVGEIGQAVLAVAVDRRRAHQIADARDRLRGRLAPGGQFRDHGLEQAHALVGAAEHEIRRAAAAGFLEWHVGAEALDRGRVRRGRGQGEGGVPFGRDHPIGAFLRRQLVPEADQPDRAARRRDAIDRDPDAAIVELEALAREPPALLGDAAQERAHEAEPGLMEAADAREPHDHLGRPEHWLR